MKNRKVVSAAGFSEKKTLEYYERLLGKRTKSTEFPAIVTRVNGDGRFEIKNLLDKAGSTVRLSRSLFLNKRAAKDDRTKVALRVGNLVLVDGEEIIAKISQPTFDAFKKHLNIHENNNAGYVFNASGGSKTRKNNRH